MSDEIIQLNQRVAELCEQGRIKLALRLARRSLRLARRQLGDIAEDTALCAYNLGRIYQATGDLCSARLHLREAATVARRALGDRHEGARYSLVILDQLSQQMQDYTGALRFSKQALALYRRALGPQHPETADRLNRVGFLLRALGRYDEAQRYYRRALAVRRKTLGPEHPDTATSLNNLGAALESMHDYAGAIACYRRAVKIFRRSRGDNDPITVGCRNNLKGVRRLLASLPTSLRPPDADPAPAPPETTAATRDSADDHTGDPPHVHTRLYEDGVTYSIDFYHSPGSRDNLSFLAQALHQLRSHASGSGLHLSPVAPYFNRCDGCGSFILTNRPHGYALACHRCGHRGHTAPFNRPDLDELLARARQVFGRLGEDVLPAAWARIQELRAEGGSYLNDGAFDRAYHALRECGELARRYLAPADPHLVGILRLLGQAHLGLGQVAEARTLYEGLRDAVREAHGEASEEYEEALDTLASAYCAAKDIESLGLALGLFKQILESREKRVGRYHRSYAMALDSVSAVCQTIGLSALAAEYSAQSINILRETLGEDHADFAIGLDNLGWLYQTAGQYERAEPLHRKALRVLRRRDQTPSLANTLMHLACVYAATGRPNKALPLVREAGVIAERFIWQVFGLSSEGRRLAYLESVRAEFDALLSIVLRDPAAPGAAGVGYDLVLGRKALVSESVAAQRDASLGGRYPQLGERLRQLAELRLQIAETALAGPARGEEEAYRQRLTGWESRRDELESELARQIPEFDLRKSLRAADRREIAQVLPQGSALVEFIQCAAFKLPAAGGQRPGWPSSDQVRSLGLAFPSALAGELHTWWGPPRLLAFVLLAGDPEGVRLFDLGEAVSIDGLVAEFRAAVIGDPQSRAIPDTPAPQARHLQTRQSSPDEGLQAGLRLRCAVLDPLREALAGRTRLFLAPDGSLTRLPFEALPEDDGSPLLVRHRISYLGTGRDVVRFSASRRAPAAPPLVVADPDFDLAATPTTTPATEPAARRSRNLPGAGLVFARLPGTRQEGEQVARTLGIRPHLGADAVERLVKGACSPHLLHLATHGFFLTDQNRDPGSVGPDLFGEGGFRRLGGTGLENPLLRSGLALAGANTWLRHGAAPAEAEDGLLTAEDVAGLDLTGTEMVVLSACETGLGEVRNGEGVYGLRRSFTLAGARTLVMSLWKVPDTQTQELMVEFYRRVLGGAARVDALREAQLALHSRNLSLYYWGAFVCQGDPGPLPGRNG